MRATSSVLFALTALLLGTRAAPIRGVTGDDIVAFTERSNEASFLDPSSQLFDEDEDDEDSELTRRAKGLKLPLPKIAAPPKVKAPPKISLPKPAPVKAPPKVPAPKTPPPKVPAPKAPPKKNPPAKNPPAKNPPAKKPTKPTPSPVVPTKGAKSTSKPVASQTKSAGKAACTARKTKGGVKGKGKRADADPDCDDAPDIPSSITINGQKFTLAGDGGIEQGLGGIVRRAGANFAKTTIKRTDTKDVAALKAEAAVTAKVGQAVASGEDSTDKGTPKRFWLVTKPAPGSPLSKNAAFAAFKKDKAACEAAADKIGGTIIAQRDKIAAQFKVTHLDVSNLENVFFAENTDFAALTGEATDPQVDKVTLIDWGRAAGATPNFGQKLGIQNAKAQTIVSVKQECRS